MAAAEENGCHEVIIAQLMAAANENRVTVERMAQWQCSGGA
jgi:hypothetical protein